MKKGTQIPTQNNTQIASTVTEDYRRPMLVADKDTCDLIDTLKEDQPLLLLLKSQRKLEEAEIAYEEALEANGFSPQDDDRERFIMNNNLNGDLIERWIGRIVYFRLCMCTCDKSVSLNTK